MAADYDALEARVAELEHQMRNVLPYRIDAIAYAVSLVHADTQAMREILERQGTALDSIERRLDRHAEMLTGHAQRFDSIERRLDRQADTLTDHGHLLAEILRRLPAEPAS